MKGRYTFILIVIISFCTFKSAAQTPCINPQPPVLSLVSVQPGSGAIEVEWLLSPSADVVAYIVHKYRGEIRTPVDTVWDPQSTRYVYNEVESQYYSLSYAVSALRLPDCESTLSNSISTIFINLAVDTCKREISLSWNSYADFPKKVLSYEIQVRTNGSAIPAIYNVSQENTGFILNNIETGEYCFVVSAILEGGSVSGSRPECVTTSMTRPPGWINADYATVNSEGKILLSYTIDPQSEIKRFGLERKEGMSGSFGLIAEIFSDNGHISYVDEKADIEKINYYRLSTINNCNPPAASSNLSSNIVISVTRTGFDLNLSWNSYREWIGTLSGYRLMVNTGEEFHEIDFLQPHDTSFLISYNTLMNQVTGSEVCFRITASETLNPYGNNGESTSAEKCVSVTEVITVPDLFTPDGDLVNDLFKPVLSFIPVNYLFIISDRRGKVVFESRDSNEQWDGTGKSGIPLPQDAYIWFLKTTGPSGKTFTKTGTITIYKNR